VEYEDFDKLVGNARVQQSYLGPRDLNILIWGLKISDRRPLAGIEPSEVEGEEARVNTA